MSSSKVQSKNIYKRQQQKKELDQMRLASALTERADLQARLSEIKIRLDCNAKVQEGDEPAEQIGRASCRERV